MRSTLLPGLALALLASVACGEGDHAVTDDSAEVNDVRGSIERALEPELTPPKSERIGADLAAIYAAAQQGLARSSRKTGDDGCTTTNYVDAANDQALQHVVCPGSEVVRITTNGLVTEHADLNKDGLVDRYTSGEGLVAQYVDRNFDGVIDVVVERVDLLEDFTLAGYGEDFPKSKFLYRIREDSDRDGKLDVEKMTARGVLPKKEE